MAAVSDFRTAASALLDRFRFFNQAGITFGGRRDLYQILGYTRVLTFRDYYDRYTRDGIAKQIVDVFPKATWRGGVELYEDEDPNTETEFERQVKEHLVDRLDLWATLQAVDILAGLSTYAVLLIGAPGDLETELPKGAPDQLLFLKSYSGGGGPGGNSRSRAYAFDACASIEKFDVDPQSRRFGSPLSYRIRQTDLATPLVDKSIHWSRVIHVAEGCLEDEVYGQPTLENVFNLLDDLAKVTGGGAESYWLRANQGLHLDVDKNMGLPGQTATGLSTTERALLQERAEEMQHQLQRVMVTRGVTAQQLGSDVANFGQSADAILKQIAGSKGIPARILMGSEMGTLASEQDAANFDSRVQDRRTGYAGPKIVRQLVDRLIAYGYLPTPAQYEVGWPVEENMDEKGKAEFALSLANVNKTQDSIVFTEDEIRDMAFDKSPLADIVTADGLSEMQKAEIASKLALTNKEMGITVFTDDEIRKITYNFAPLADAQKVPIGAPERISVTQPPKLEEDGLPLLQKGQAPEPQKSSQPLVPTHAALERAIEENDVATIGRLVGIEGEPANA